LTFRRKNTSTYDPAIFTFGASTTYLAIGSTDRTLAGTQRIMQLSATPIGSQAIAAMIEFTVTFTDDCYFVEL